MIKDLIFWLLARISLLLFCEILRMSNAWHSTDSNITFHVAIYYDNYCQLVDMFEHRGDVVGVYI
jgi:hypothetical protein